MKVIKKTADTFKPITIEITFESQREIDFWYEFIGNTSASDRQQIVDKGRFSASITDNQPMNSRGTGLAPAPPE